MDIGELNQLNGKMISGRAPDHHTFFTSATQTELLLEVIGPDINLELRITGPQSYSGKLVYINLPPGKYNLDISGKGPYRLRFDTYQTGERQAPALNKLWNRVELSTIPKYSSLSTHIDRADEPWIATQGKSGFIFNNKWTEINLSPVDAVFADPGNSNRVYALSKEEGAPYKLMVSNDRGVTFKELISTAKVYAHNKNRALVFNPKTSQHILLIGDKLLESTDNGETWKDSRLNDEIPPSTKIIGATFDPSKRGHIYAWASDGVVYKSTDSGAHWEWLSMGPLKEVVATTEGPLYLLKTGVISYQGRENLERIGTVVGHPYQAREMLAGGERLYYTDSNWASYKEITGAPNDISDIIWHPQNPRKVWVISKSGEMKQLQDIYFSGEPSWKGLQYTVPEDSVYAIEATDDGALYIVGRDMIYTLKDNVVGKELGPFTLIKGSPDSKQLVRVREGTEVEVLREGKWVSVTYPGAMLALPISDISISNDGKVFIANKLGLCSTEEHYSTLPKDPQGNGRVCLDKEPGVIYYSSGNRLFRCDEEGGWFNQVYHNLPTIYDGARYYPSPISGEVWATCRYSGLYKSHDRCETFHKVMDVTYAGALCFGPPINEFEPYAVYLSGKVRQIPGIYMSRDLGNTWIKLGVLVEVTTMCASMITPGLVYVGTRGQGLFY